ncbi:hypothetical protein MRB53_037578 [Persea americana]|nr:hypothetical protein MRB53_037578 [Persea americana]
MPAADQKAAPLADYDGTEQVKSISPQRRESLEKHLQQRPDPQELKQKHILLDTNAAPSLQSKQLELERQRATDSLKKGLGTRADRDELVEKNILPATTAAPALQSSQRELQKHMRKDSLEKALQTRPKKDELIEEGILGKHDEAVTDSAE